MNLFSLSTAPGAPDLPTGCCVQKQELLWKSDGYTYESYIQPLISLWASPCHCLFILAWDQKSLSLALQVFTLWPEKYLQTTMVFYSFNPSGPPIPSILSDLTLNCWLPWLPLCYIYPASQWGCELLRHSSWVFSMFYSTQEISAFRITNTIYIKTGGPR